MRGSFLATPAVGIAAALLAAPALAQEAQATAQSVSAIQDLSLEQLSQMPVTSVSKAPMALSAAPAAVYVITRDDIRRSGATTIPEILRLAPNLEVFQTSASQYVITARGFNGASAAQSFSNKLLVLIDGRSVYTPLFSGVYWDMQGVPAENIERIEVISGPGATLWGANAVNGVINIITRGPDETQGLSLALDGGLRTASASAQFGGRAGDLAYRIYGQGVWFGDTRLANGDDAHDAWSRPQAGFRVDWTPPGANSFTLQGDAFNGSENQDGAPDQNISERNIVGRWTHASANGSEVRLQAYYDRSERGAEDGGGHFDLSVYDIDLQHNFSLGGRHDIVWGGGVRIEDYNIHGSAGLQFDPPSRTLTLANVFAEDTIRLNNQLRLTLGLKAEDDPYSGLAWLPDARLSWQPRSNVLFWAAASRAVRAPTPFDRDVVERSGGNVFLTGDPTFLPETLTAYEVGLRVQPTPQASLSISTFFQHYDDLRSIEVTDVTFIPLHWGNGMNGDTRGIEIWGDYEITDWWRLSGAYTYLEEDLSFDSDASGLLGVAQAGNDPRHQASLTSSMNLPGNVTFDARLRYVSLLPDPHVPAYVELNTRLGWRVNARVELALSGFNLLHDQHAEYAPANEIPREIAAEVRVRY